MSRRSLVLSVTVATVLIGGTGLASASGASTDVSRTSGHATIAEVKHRVDERATKLTARLTAAQQKIDANPRLSTVQKATLDGDIATTLADVATAKAQVDAAITRAQLKAARPALRTVRADLRRLRADRAAIRAAVRSSHRAAA